ncbi:hypothetical protein INS49_014740 [Diaporthe citri]|uniref:uncharacterized protein n=1 Tax=Diaporthe citri TaxID=83186 RepID=UPI001C8247DD|nr:uncharacterized protein INS49_014740 [Diaporthe citri]KAG6356866.1 hypothetical protein INS49_014740 [Diaporthe citri]
MLPLRLRGTRCIRTRYVCSSCCAHISQGTSAHGRVAAVTRTYATGKTTGKKKTAATTPGKSSEDVKPSDATENSSPTQPPQADKSTPLKEQKVKAKEGEKPAHQRKKKAPSPSKASKDETAPAAARSKKTDETAKLWQETLDILKNLQQTQDVDGGALANEAASKEGAGKKDDADTKRSLKSHFPPIQSAPSNKARERQAKLLEGTLDVLKSVLTTQAGQGSKASKTAKITEAPSPKAKPERKQTVSKGAKEEGKKLPSNKSVTSEAAVAQGFAALLHSTQAKKKAAQERDSKGDSVEKGPLAPKRPKKEGEPGKGGDAGWGFRKETRNVKKVKTKNVGLEPVHVDTAPVPRVEYGLDRVLFNEGVYVLQDPRTRVFNFDPYLATIMPVDEFDFEALKQYVTSSKDTTLIGVAKKHNKKFTGSTSSMTSTLAHFHYLLSSWRPINPERISKGYTPDSENFGAILRAPAATFLHYKDGTYAIDADKEYDTDTILSMLGKSMEKLLTAPKEEYEKYRRSNSHQLTEEERNAMSHIITQRVFDLKTRAVVSIRMDAQNHHKGVGYEIRQRQGQWESFEREYYDMIRLAFLKYSLQVRMGRMDGIFVAYHNTQRIFGFQYIPLEEMDLSLHGTTDLTTGNREFMASLELWEEMLKKATERFPGKSLRIHVETRTSTVVPFMYFFAEPVNDDEIRAIQEENKEEAEKFQERVLGIKPKPDAAAEAAREEPEEDEEASAGEADAAEDEAASKDEAVEEAKEAEEDVQEVDEEDSEDVWEDMMDVVEQTMESDAQGISAIRDAIEDALEQSGLLHARSSEEAEQYVEALLKAIVDVDAEKVKTDDEAEAPESESESSGEQKQDHDVRPAESTDTVEQGDSSPPAPKPSRFGFLSSWFGSGAKEADAPAKLEPTSETGPDKDINTLPEQDLAPKDDAAEPAATESKAADDKPDDSLKDLLIKLTTRIGSSIDAQKATEELSEDQAKLRKFESILLEMMPKTQEAPADAAAEEDAAAPSDADKGTAEDTPAPGDGGEPAAKPVLGLVLTVRNKVNTKYVQRPEKLTASDKWNVEYTIEELPGDKVQGVYQALKKRRHGAHFKDPGRDRFRTAFDGLLTHYSKAGQQFRSKETKLARKLPVHVVGQVQPVSLPSSGTSPGGDLPTSGRATRKTKVQRFMPPEEEKQRLEEEKKQRLEEEKKQRLKDEALKRLQAKGKTRFNLGEGWARPHQPEVMKLQAEGKTPFNLGEAWLRPQQRRNEIIEGTNEENTKDRKKFSGMKRLSLAGEETATKNESLVEEEATVEVVENGSASFREWRERDQQKQDKDEEQEKEKDS